MRNLKVLFWIRPDFYTFPGGDTVQVEYTAQALSELGCKVDLSSDPRIDIRVYDIIHLWHLERCHETWLFFQKAKRNHKRIFLAPIYWPSNQIPLTGFWSKQLKAIKENSKNIIRLGTTSTKDQKWFIMAALRKGWLRCREQLLNHVDLLLSNSASEADILRQEQQSDVPIAVIPNVVDVKKCDVIKKLPWERRTMLLCVGHFCPRKNQLALIESLKGTDLSVVFAGGSRPMHRIYYEHCRKEAAGQHTFLNSCSGEKILQLMSQAKVHIQVSTAETPGLVNLEAGLMGCNVVLPPLRPVRDYFEDFGHYFFTYEKDSIRKAIVDAINTEPYLSLENHIRGKFTMMQLKSRLSAVYW
jgi:glycosyltransferase involved in cell wall biosynthesis